MTSEELNAYLTEALAFERQENVRLTNILLAHLGVLPSQDTTVHVESSVNKVPIGRRSARDVLASLERKYAGAAVVSVDHELLDLDAAISNKEINGKE